MTEEIKSKIPLWDKHYRVYKPTILGRIMYGSHRKVLEKVMNEELELPKDVKLLDVGCGRGSTLASFRSWGFYNSIGIDLADSGLERCQIGGFELGKDVFKIDATATPYDDESFDIVFSEGMLEHYEDFSPFVKEMCRLSNDYIILVQPNHFCLYGRLIQWAWGLLRKNSGGVEELTYHFEEFYGAFAKYGFIHMSTRYTSLKENAVLVFRRGSGNPSEEVEGKRALWVASQRYEKDYIESGRDLDWGIPCSLEYWKNFLRLDDLSGIGVEVGCGSNGVSRFTDNIIGIDPIDYSDRIKNFKQGMGEDLPFDDYSVDFIICSNVLDHCLDPQKVIDEMFRVAKRIVLWVYIHPRVVKYVMLRIDKTHLYRFTKEDVEKLLSRHKFKVTKTFIYTFTDEHLKYVKTWRARIKLLVGYLVGVRGLCIHLEH